MSNPAPSNLPEETPARRAVLIDFDWQDSDLIPALVRHPGITVRLVAGERPDEAGLRIAELCGLPRTVDLADLTREIFDLALISERSPRRTQVEGLLLALGTPSLTPQSWLEGQPLPDGEHPAIEAPLALHAAAFEDSLGGEAFRDVVEQALPDVSSDAPTTPQPVRPTAQPGATIQSLDDFPSREDRRALEDALLSLMNSTGAASAQLHAGHGDRLELVAQAGKPDALLAGLVQLALEVNQPQVVSPLSGPSQGRVWGAWPFRTTQHRGVLAAAGIEGPVRCSPWERMVDEMRSTWDRRDRDGSGPLVPDPERRWLAMEAMLARCEEVAESAGRNRTRCAIHRLEFAVQPDALARLQRELPREVRESDALCRPSPTIVLLLTTSPATAFLQVRRRLLAMWERAWSDAKLPPPAAPIVDRHVELVGPEDTQAFLDAARTWLSQG